MHVFCELFSDRLPVSAALCGAFLAFATLVGCGEERTDARAAEVAAPVRFQDAAGNVACLLGPDGVQCDVAEREWSPGTPPENCLLDWGNGIALDADGAELTCAGDTLLGEGDELPAGATPRSGEYWCEVHDDGVSCWAGSGRGFHIGRDSWERW